MAMTPSTMITPPSMAPTPVTLGLNHFQNSMMTPPAMAPSMTQYSMNQQAVTPPTMQTPPSMFPTPITPSTITPPSMGSNNFQNPQNMVAPTMATDYTNPYWTPYGTWNTHQMTRGAAMAPAQLQWNMMNAQFGHPGSIPQNNNYNGNDMSFLHGSTAADFDFRF
ncbi:hypothetical protein CAEBREN_16309 [Caenorhabditis brenneri]|uniref:Uncharacterized protein n=1 Tax=Caenorhabditis brenneri TaxID=135651 RepID=G0MCY2_CAEBE|nr:hypothetical protein CAEBREN_16309 [Caenorhabditis brenneri]